MTILSSTYDSPSIILPSTGILSPGFTIKISPTITSPTGICTSLLSLKTLAVLTCNPISFLIASDVCPFALASKNFPSKIKVIIVADVSK